MSSLNRIKKRAKNLQEEKATGVKTSSSLSNIVANAESKRAGTFTYDDIAPVKTTSKKVSTSSSNSSLLKRREELQSLINNYDRKEKREWWDSDDNVLENVGNVFYKLFAEKQDSKYVKDDKFDALVKEYDDITEQIQNNSVENREYSDDLTGFVDKSADVILGNFTTGTKGISTTAKKILGQELTEEDYGLSYAEKLGQKASSSAANSIEKAILDVEGGIARMIPQMATGDPMVSTIVGFANYGGGAYNEARQDGYTDEQATKYGITIGSLEMAMTKALGSFGKIYGSSKLGKISQSVIDKFIPKIISNKQVRQVLSQFGSEGIEEFLQEYTGKIVKDTLLDEKGLSNSTWENITDTDLLADALYSGFIGGITGAALDVPNAIARNNYEKTTGRNVDTAYTQNKQTVIDSLVEEQSTEIAKQQAIENEINKAISSKETEQGGSLSAKEKTALTEAIKSKIETGEIDVSNNKLTNKEISKIRQEIEEKLQKGQLDTTKIDSILGDTLTEQDALLSRSYEEQAKKGQNFTYDNTKVTNEQEKAVYESAAKYFNDTTRSHEFVEKVAKISKDKGTNYGFINNEELSSLGHDVEGKQVNGLVRTNKDGKQTVLINIDSPRALNTIVGHETTHLLEGTQEYTDLQEAIFNYAKEKGDFDSRQKALNELYEGIENANIDSELTADLVGEYLFTDEKFIDSLSTQKPTLFQKIKELIDDLVVRFKGTKEEKALREVQKKFKEAYKNQNNNIGNEIKYMMTSTKGMENGLAINTRYQDIKNRYEKALQLETNENYTNEDIRQETGWFKDNQGNWEFEISDQYMKMKIQPKENSKYKLSEIFDANTLYEMYPELKDMPVEFKDIKSNGSYNSETKKITINNTLINNLDNLRGTLLHEIQHYIQHTEGLPTGTNILFGNEQYANSKGEIEAADTKRRRNLTVEQRKSIIPESAKDNPVHPNREAILNRKRNTVEKIAEKLYNIFGDEASEIFEENIEKTDNENIELDGKLGNNQQVYRGFNNRIKELEDSSFSYDNQGRTLTKEQQEYFKDSKVRDKKGKLEVMYRGDTGETINVFDKNKSKKSNLYGTGFYFSDESMASLYGNTTPYYLNIVNPLYVNKDTHNITKEQYSNFIKLAIENEDYSFENYGNISTDELINKLYDGRSDFKLINDVVATAMGDYRDAFDVFEKANGIKYDGIISNSQTVVFNSNQIKNIDNTNPTSDEDIRYSLSEADLKQKQLDIILENNPVEDDYHTWIRSIDDIKTFEETLQDDDWADYVEEGFNPDYTGDMVKEAQETGKITVYSSYPIEQGIFVSPSRMEAESYSSNGKVYSKEVDLTDVAWIDPTQGQYAKVEVGDYSLSNPNEDIAPTGDYNVYGEEVKLAPLQEEIKTLTETVQELKEQIAPVKQTEEYRALIEEDLPMLEQQYNEAPMNDIAPPEIEQTIDYMPDAISMDSKTLKILTRNVKNELGLNRVQTAELEKVVQEFTTNETATREDLFNAISERFSEQTLEHKNEEIIAIKSFLRNYPIKVSNYLKTEFKEGFNKVRQSNFNKLKFTNDGIEVDAAYQELSSMYPSLFPNDITNAQDQLSKIIEVANLDVMSTEEFVLPENMVQETSNFIYDSIQDYKLDEVFKAAEQVRKLPIDESLMPVETVENPVENKEIAPVKAQKIESAEENKNLTIKESNALKLKNLEAALEKYRVDAENSFNSFKELIREKNSEYDALANKNTLKANNLLQQVRRLVAQRDNIQVEYERKMNNIQKRIERMNSKDFKTSEQRMSKQQEYREQARSLIGDTSTWKDKKLGIQYQINTFKRNLRDIVKGADGKADILTADAIYEEYQGNYNRNEAKLKVESNKIKQPYMDMKLTKQEDAYVQMLGELKYNPDTTLRQDVVEGYYELNKDNIDINKVNKAIEMARKTYDSLHERINEVLRNQGMKEMGYRQGYFPHFIEEKQGMLAKLFDWKIKNNEIPTDIAGLTELNNPERSWQSFNKQRKGDTTDYSFSKGLDTYVHGALDWIYHIEDIQKRRALENEIRYQHSEKGVQEKIEAIYNNPELDADEVQTQIEAIYGVAKNPLNNFVTDLRNSTNNLTGKKSSADRGLEYATNRQIYSIMTNISSRVSGNMVGGSISSALTNFIPITQSWGEVSPLSSLNAIRETIKSSIKDDGTIAKSTFLTNRLVKEEKLSKTNWDKASDVVSVMTDVIDNITSQTVWRSKYNENIKNGMSEFNAIKNADQFAENVIAGRSRGNQPTIFNSKNPITKMLTAFQLEVANQYGYMLKDMPTDISEKSKGKLIKGYASMFMGAYLYNALYSSLTGRDSAFDPIGIVEDILKEFGFGDDDEEEKSASEKLTSITEDLVQEIPFIGGLFGGGRLPISSAIPYENPFEMATGTMTDILDAFDEEKKEKALKDLTSEWLKPVTYLALPFGGGQISKSIKGLSMYDEDLPIAGSYTNGGDLRFTADESLGGKLKSFLFGQYASKSAQEYVDSGFKTIKKSNIEELMDLGMTSTEYRKYRQELKNAGNTNKSKLDYINGLDAPISHKNIMANNVLDRDYKVDMRDYTTYDEFDFSYKNPEKYEWLQKNNISYSDYIANDESKEAYNWAYSNPESYLVSRTVTDDVVAYRQYKSEIGNLKADYNSNGKQIKDSRRNKVIDYVSSLNLSVPQRAILIRQEYLTFNDYNNEIVEYVRNLNISYDEKVSILEELDMTVKDGRVYWK